MDNAVGEQAAAFVPYLLFVFGLEAQLAKIGVGDGAAQLVGFLCIKVRNPPQDLAPVKLLRNAHS